MKITIERAKQQIRTWLHKEAEERQACRAATRVAHEYAGQGDDDLARQMALAAKVHDARAEELVDLLEDWQRRINEQRAA